MTRIIWAFALMGVVSGVSLSQAFADDTETGTTYKEIKRTFRPDKSICLNNLGVSTGNKISTVSCEISIFDTANGILRLRGAKTKLLSSAMVSPHVASIIAVETTEKGYSITYEVIHSASDDAQPSREVLIQKFIDATASINAFTESSPEATMLIKN